MYIPPTLEAIDAVRPSVYNPRQTDPARLELVKLSLRKLGFVLPIYTNPDGEILSGHQRHLGATQLGFTHIPVVRLPRKKNTNDKGLNLVFNRSTNDMTADTNTKTLWAELSQADLSSFDRFADALDQFPCLNAVERGVKELLQVNQLSEEHYARKMAQIARRRGVVMPLVIESDGKLINGAGRLRLAAEEQDETAKCIVLPPEIASFARAMLNKLSMDFEVHAKYADVLRHNAFRRRMGVKDYLGHCFTFALLKGKPAHTFDINKPDHKARWTKLFGTTVADFGAGLMDETRMLRAAGINSHPFEPYVIGDDDKPDLEKSRKVVQDFLAAVTKKVEFHSVFGSAILNSIPFVEDRRKVLTIIASLMGPRTTFYTHCIGANAARLRNLLGAESKDLSLQETATFLLDYEKNTTIGDLAESPKVQKLHEPQELHALLSKFFDRVDIRTMQPGLSATCRNPKRIDPDQLRAALEFEFDLPHPRDKSLGLAVEAKAAFAERLGLNLM